MIEPEFEDRFEALYAMRGRPCDSEPIDERVIDEPGVTSVSSRMPRHVVRFTYFLSHGAIIGTHASGRIT